MTALAVLGLIIIAAGSAMFVYAAFRTGLLWGLGTLFVPFVGIAFLIVHWRAAWKGLLVFSLGLAIFIVSALAGGRFQEYWIIIRPVPTPTVPEPGVPMQTVRCLPGAPPGPPPSTPV